MVRLADFVSGLADLASVSSAGVSAVVPLVVWLG